MRSSSQPAWLIMLIAAALVFAGWHLWQGAQNYLRSGGLGVREVTLQAGQRASATTIRELTSAVLFVPPPSRTPMPECQPFVVVVPEAVVRAAPSGDAGIVGALFEADEVCVISPAPAAPDWYLLDEQPRSRRIEAVYVHRTLLRALEPTATPFDTATPLSTITPGPDNTPDPAAATATFTPTPVVSPTSPLRSA